MAIEDSVPAVEEHILDLDDLDKLDFSLTQKMIQVTKNIGSMQNL